MNARMVNLRTRRKQQARDDRLKAAGDSPAPHVSKAERERAKAENRRARDRLEGGLLDDRPPDLPGDEG